jgi:hypothetical protein
MDEYRVKCGFVVTTTHRPIQLTRAIMAIPWPDPTPTPIETLRG